MSKQDEYNDLMDFIHRHYSDREIEEYNSYSCFGKEDAPQVTVTVSTNTYGH